MFLSDKLLLMPRGAADCGGGKADMSSCPLFPEKQTFVPKADIQAAFRYYCWWARVLKFVEHHP